jgi:hypothetical protein
MDSEKDPILSPQEMWQDAGFSKATWVRHYRKLLEQRGLLIRLCPRRIGVRQSAWRNLLAERRARGSWRDKAA